MSNLPKSALAEAEEAHIKQWANHKTYLKSVANRIGQERFVFYDGPPFANGLPHWGNLMTSVLKDAVMRYQTMQGKYAPRRFGWDCHGLPPELQAEKELGLSGKLAIQKYGVEKFVDYCRDSVLRFTKEWHYYVERIERWVDFEDDYRTMDPGYMESVIWAFKSLYDKGLIYEGERVVPYSYGAQTSLSNFETRVDDSYRDREDITATFKVVLEDGRVALVWTTVPWTIPANLLLAVGESIDYCNFKLADTVYVVAVAAIDRFPELKAGSQLSRFKGSQLLGMSYQPVFPYFEGSENSFKIVSADFVETESGTGIVSIAPGHGEDDYWLGKQVGTPIISPVDDAGCFTDEVKDYYGRLVFDANNEIVADLKKSDQLFVSDVYFHKYPHCWRTDVPIIYRAMSAWFVDVPKIKQELLAANQEIDWHPKHVKDGAFGKWLANAREWNISRKRFWGAPLPVWKTEDGEIIVVGSLAEIKQKAVDPKLVTDLHRPQIDNVVLKTEAGKLAYRVDDVFDCWFESGSMPFAQFHYPFENKDLFETGHPSHFITEYVGQMRGWFYTLHVMSVALFGKPAFKTAVSHGILLGTDSRKMSKHLGNYPEVESTFASQGADAVRFYLLSSALFSGETASFDPRAVIEAQRNVIQRLLNVLSFFSLYADIDGFTLSGLLKSPKVHNDLDKWLIARLNQTINEVTNGANLYDTPLIGRSLSLWLDDLSNWYVRRSRRRFWKSQDDSDKAQAYTTLAYALARTSQLMAPWTPAVAETVWQAVTAKSQEPESVHISDWPIAETYSQDVIDQMSAVREIVTQGLALRANAGIKVRQPLASLIIASPTKLPKALQSIISEEVNVKHLVLTQADHLTLELDTTMTPELESEGLARDIIRQVQAARKAADLVVDDRIKLNITGDQKIMQAVVSHKSIIMAETLAVSLAEVKSPSYSTDIKLGQIDFKIELAKTES